MIVFIDTNLLLDVALHRVEFYESSKAAIARCDREKFQTVIAWHTLSNLHFILSKVWKDKQAVRDFLASSLQVYHVAPVGQADAVRALNYHLDDFEDALQLSAAQSCSASVLLTRDKFGFGHPSFLRLMTPAEFSVTSF